MTGAEALALEAAAWLAPVQGHPLFGVCVTVAACAAADHDWRRAGRLAVLNRVLIATVRLGSLLLLLLDIPYETYLRQAEPINEMLALTVVLLVVPLCRQFRLIQTAGAPVGGALVDGSLAAIAVAIALPALVMPETGLIMTLAPKSMTTADRGRDRGKVGRSTGSDGGGGDRHRRLRYGLRPGDPRRRRHPPRSCRRLRARRSLPRDRDRACLPDL